ncbi:MAG TPA: molybdopterin-binding protein [Alphaproteobacteria bacterium]|nr:molybdopterin-binding protein [Alphaproteobacteria bacterium]
MSASASGRPVTAAVILIGNEILSGRTQDANLAYIAERLNEAGVRVMEGRVVADIESDIVEAVNACRARHDYVFTTGGIGPTHDDITSAAVAKAFGLPLLLNAEAKTRLERHYPADKLNEARLRMAMVPQGASLIDNPISAAPGFRIGNVFVMAGVPVIMRAMIDSLLHTLSGGAPMRARTFRTNLGEGTMAADLTALQQRFGDVEIGSYPSFGKPGETGVRIVLRGIDAARLAEASEGFVALAQGLGGEAVEIELAQA